MLAISAALCSGGSHVPGRAGRADLTAHSVWVKIERLLGESISIMVRLAHAPTEQSVPTPREGRVWTHTGVARLIASVVGSGSSVVP